MQRQIIEDNIALRANLVLEKFKPADVDRVGIKHIQIEDEVFTLPPEALFQLYNKLNIYGPISSLRKSFSKSTELRSTVDYLVRFGLEQSSNLQLQMIVNRKKDKPEIAGIVGSRYHLTTHKEVYYPALEVLGVDNLDEKFSFINAKVMNLTFKSDFERDTPKVGEPVGAGIHIYSSDSGWASIGYGFMFWLLVCSNGLIVSKSLVQNRIFHSSEQAIGRYIELLQGEMNNMNFNKFVDFVDKSVVRPAIVDKAEDIPEVLRMKRVPVQYDEKIIDYAKNRNRGLKLNGFGIGNAVNGFATHEIASASERHPLLKKAFDIMAIGVKF